MKSRRPMGRYVAWIFLLLVLAAVGSYQSLLSWIGKSLVYVDAPGTCDAIVVAAGNDSLREAQAVKLYRKGYAPRIILTGGRAGWRTTVPMLMAAHIRALGVTDSALSVQESTDSPYEAAKRLKKLALSRGWQSIMVISSSFESARIRRVFHHFFPKPFYTVRIVSYREVRFGPSTWWRCQSGRDAVYDEICKSLLYKLKHRL